jgi:hypothetical protein
MDDHGPRYGPLSDLSSSQHCARLCTKRKDDLDGTDPHKSSAALRDLFNAIKHATEQLSEDDALIYTRRAFDHAFANASDSSAVVASRSTAHPILALNRDYRVEV